MFSKELTYKDMTISISGLSGKFHVRCRGFERRDLTQNELAALVYPALDAEAKQLEKVPSSPPLAGT